MKDPIITNNILNWYDLNKRSLPWRKNVSQTKKQYYTLVSEFMLQQTQVATVIPYFNRFIKNIPTIEKLSKYDDRKLIKLWEGLGYYSRVRNLKKTAQIVVKNFNKKIPRNFVDLKSLPGIGDYTASAISAIAFNEPIIPLDGNIERVLKRYLFLKKQDQIKKENLHEKKKIFGTSIKRSSDYAQALMELGALICKPVSPNCKNCPLVKKCKSFKNKNFDLVKFKKKGKETFYKLNVYKKNNSLLPAVVAEVGGNFNRGDVISVYFPKKEKIAVGISAYDINEVKKIIGKKSKEIPSILGYEGRDEIIHKDDLVKIIS